MESDLTSRPVMRPLGLQDESLNNDTIDLLQERLNAAEEETQGLVEQLAKIGYAPDKAEFGNIRDKKSAIAPYKTRIADPEILQKNYEVLVSRVCKTESALQTLRLTLTRVQADRDVNKKEKFEVTEKLSNANATYEKELHRLQKDLSQSRKEVQDAQEDRRQLQEEVRRLQGTLDVATSTKSEVTVEAEDLKLTKQKLTRKLNEVRDELARETSLRSSLEDSHNSLLTRIKEMETIVEKERDEVKNMNTTCNGLKRDCIQAQEIAKNETQMRQHLEEQLMKFRKDTDNNESLVKTLEKDKQFLISELGKMKARYADLHGQIDQMAKLMDDKKCAQHQLEAENKNLYAAMKSAAEHNAKLISQYEEQIQVDKAEWASKVQSAEQIKSLRNQLTEESREKGQLQGTCAQLEEQLLELQEKMSKKESDSAYSLSKQQDTIQGLKERLKGIQKEKDRALKDKENLMDEVNSAVDGMSEERGRFQGEIEKARIEIESLQQAKQQMMGENATLLERLGTLEEHKAAQQHVEKTMTEMLEQKNKLAYDKGRLQSKVEQLQKDLESLANAQTDVVQAKKLNTTLEAKYHKSQAELNAARMAFQRLESELKHSHSSGERKEQDFSMAIRARDDALKEAEKLRNQVEILEERERQKNYGTKRNLDEAREDNKQIAYTLESIMNSHSQLQTTIEGLQVELGKKDTQINQLQNEKSESLHRQRQLQREADNLQTKLLSLESMESSEVDPLRSSLQKCKDDNAKLASSLEAVVNSNTQLQSSLQAMQDQVEKKTFLLDQTNQARERDQDSYKDEVKTYEDRLDNLRQQLLGERNKNLKKTNKEVAEVRKQLEELLSRNGELSRTNTELRHKVTEVEYKNKEMKDRVSGLKSQVDHLTKVKKKHEETIESLSNISDQLDDLERIKKEYTSKNQKQSRVIKNFQAQVNSLQSELHTLAKAQVETAELLQQQEEDLETERKYSDELKRKLKECRKREQHLDRLREQTEEKLSEANNESMQISYSLQDAHDWFKSKFESLQGELIKSRKSHTDLEHEHYEQRLLLDDEKRKARETTDRAKEMIKASRETISRVADVAEINQHENKKQVEKLKEQLLREKQNGLLAEKKLREIKAASLRHTEELAQELDLLKSTSLNSGDSYLYS